MGTDPTERAFYRAFRELCLAAVPESGCFRADAEKGAANPPRLAWTGMNICFRDTVSGVAANSSRVASGRRLFALSNLLQFCRNFVGEL